MAWLYQKSESEMARVRRVHVPGDEAEELDAVSVTTTPCTIRAHQRPALLSLAPCASASGTVLVPVRYLNVNTNSQTVGKCRDVDDRNVYYAHGEIERFPNHPIEFPVRFVSTAAAWCSALNRNQDMLKYMFEGHIPIPSPPTSVSKAEHQAASISASKANGKCNRMVRDLSVCAKTRRRQL